MLCTSTRAVVEEYTGITPFAEMLPFFTFFDVCSLVLSISL